MSVECSGGQVSSDSAAKDVSSIDPYKLQKMFTPDFDRETGKAQSKLGQKTLILHSRSSTIE